MDDLLGEASLYKQVIAMLPATTDQITRFNPRVHPDAVLAKLKYMQQHGHIHNLGGLWCVVRVAEDRPYVKPETVRGPPKPCLICGQPIRQDAKKYCSRTCSGIGDRVKRKPCKLCGKPVNRNTSIYCSKECTDKDRTNFPRKKKITRTCARCGALVQRTINKYCGSFCYRMAEKERRPKRSCPCGKILHPSQHKYCSVSCRGNTRHSPKKPCKQCGKPVKRNVRTFCSNECYRMAEKERA